MRTYKHFLFLIGIIILLFIFFYKSSDENFDNYNKPNDIPYNIFQTWKIKDLPPKMKECVENLKRENPEFTHYLYDDIDCRNFIIKNFDKEVIKAYDSLIPGAFKADLWRYCILYKLGGIYLDIKYYCVNGFKLKSLTDKEVFIRDIEVSGSGIYNAFMICKAGNKKMLNCINKIVDNVKNKYYGNNVFEPTGPLLLFKEFSQDELNNLPPITISEDKCPTKTCISMNGKPILAIYKEYRDEQKEFFSKEKTKYYYDLWNERKIYV
jgi:mannosyltransferase OCH1-like enzyme